MITATMKTVRLLGDKPGSPDEARIIKARSMIPEPSKVKWRLMSVVVEKHRIETFETVIIHEGTMQYFAWRHVGTGLIFI